MSKLGSMILLAAVALAPAAASGQAKVDPNLPDYKPVGNVSGTIKSVGSDTMNNLMAYWTEGFSKHYPNVNSDIDGKGSSTAVPALITGAANFGPMSRAVKPAEAKKFSSRFGYKPIQLASSIDMLAVYVNKDNPIKSLTLTQVDAIFSSTRKRGGKKDIRTWSQLGLTGNIANSPISCYGRNAASGTYGYFKKVALKKGDYKNSVKEQPGSAAVIQGIAKDIAAIGYSGIGYMTPDVRAVPLAKAEGKKAYPAEAKYAYSRKYPLARSLWVTVNHAPGSKMEPLRREFLRFVFSKQGQELVLKAGYFPVTAAVAKAELAKVGIE